MSIESNAPAERSARRAYSVPALTKGLSLVEILAAEIDGLTQTEIAARTGRTVSENFRTLFCLEEAGYVRRGEGDRFRLSMKLFTLAHRFPPTRRVIDAALPKMHALTHRTRQSCHLSIETDGQLLIVAQVESPAPVGVNVRIGARHHMATTASGRVLLAHQSLERRIAALADVGLAPDSAHGRLALDRIDRIARLGFESVADDTLYGIVDLGCPVFDHTGVCIAALTIPFITSTGGDNPIEQALALLSEAARDASRALGYLPIAAEPAQP